MFVVIKILAAMHPTAMPPICACVWILSFLISARGPILTLNFLVVMAKGGKALSSNILLIHTGTHQSPTKNSVTLNDPHHSDGCTLKAACTPKLELANFL